MVLTIANVIAVKGPGATPTGKMGEEETGMGPGWQAYIEAEPRVRGREVMHRVTACHKLPFTRERNFQMREPVPLPFFCDLLSSKSHTQKIVKSQKTTF